MIVTRLAEFFFALLAGAFVAVASFVGLLIWWKLDDFLTDRDIEKAYPELKRKRK